MGEVGGREIQKITIIERLIHRTKEINVSNHIMDTQDNDKKN